VARLRSLWYKLVREVKIQKVKFAYVESFRKSAYGRRELRLIPANNISDIHHPNLVFFMRRTAYILIPSEYHQPRTASKHGSQLIGEDSFFVSTRTSNQYHLLFVKTIRPSIITSLEHICLHFLPSLCCSRQHHPDYLLLSGSLIVFIA
jgi:hypothetical protein